MAATSRARREGIWSSAPHINGRRRGYRQMESDEDEDSDYSDEKLSRMYPLASSSTSTINSTVSFASTAAPLAAPSSTYNFGDEKLLRYAMYGSDEYISLGDRHHDQELRQLDADEKFLQLPDPSPFEGVCTCRGIVNIMGIVTVLIGLILLILGYPIARFSHLDRGATELAPSLPMNASGHLPPAFIASSALGRGDPESADMLLGEFLQGITGEGSQRPRVSRAKTLMIDPDTPMNQRTRVAIDGSEWHLVFSDEFNREGRSFGPGQDPHWEAVELRSQEHGSDDPVEDYARDAITTKGGHLEIQLSREEVHDSQLQKRQDDKALLKYKYTSGMLQSWNKLCFQGGILEVSVSIPSIDNAHVLKPRVFALGNLARYGFMSTMDGVWPYSYSTCDVETHLKLNRSNSAAEASTGSIASSAQRLNACLQHRSKDSPSPGVGRGAPQIDLLEVYQNNIIEPTSIFAQNLRTLMAKRDSKKSQDYSLTKQQRLIRDDGSRIVAAQHLHTSKTLVSFPHERYSTLSQMDGPQAGGVGSRYSTAVSSLTVAAPSLPPPGDKVSTIASDSANVTTIQQLSMIQHEDPLLPVSSPLSKQVHASPASVSSTTKSGNVQPSSGYVSVAVEYWPKITQYEATNAIDAYLRFMVNNSWHHPIVESTFNSSAKSSSPIAEAKVSSGAAGGSTTYMYTNSAQLLSEGLLIPQEPMSIVLSLGLFHQSHDNLGQQSSHHATAEESLHAMLSNPALKWPIVMKVDYVRLYQPTQALIADSEKAAVSRSPAFKASTALSCDPFDHPTARYIQDHPAAYTDASKKTWADAGYQSPAL
ncbi:hypothetical protein BGW42_000012 [Actinomortierella wolfii]|nr:hypothetical protein BGW42_000012 [Actinomortierella wolfii]